MIRTKTMTQDAMIKLTAVVPVSGATDASELLTSGLEDSVIPDSSLYSGISTFKSILSFETRLP